MSCERKLMQCTLVKSENVSSINPRVCWKTTLCVCVCVCGSFTIFWDSGESPLTEPTQHTPTAMVKRERQIVVLITKLPKGKRKNSQKHLFCTDYFHFNGQPWEGRGGWCFPILPRVPSGESDGGPMTCLLLARGDAGKTCCTSSPYLPYHLSPHLAAPPLTLPLTSPDPSPTSSPVIFLLTSPLPSNAPSPSLQHYLRASQHGALPCRRALQTDSRTPTGKLSLWHSTCSPPPSTCFHATVMQCGCSALLG